MPALQGREVGYDVGVLQVDSHHAVPLLGQPGAGGCPHARGGPGDDDGSHAAHDTSGSVDRSTMAERRRTSTSNFGAGRREAHDASAFYARFEAPELSADADVADPRPVDDPFVCGDARNMDAV